jgi:hypothetical protein
MRYFLSGLLALAWALWFGGIVSLFLFINRLFESMKDEYRGVFDVVAPQQFRMAERFGIVAGGLALLVAFAMRLLTRGVAATWLFALLAIAAVLEVVRPVLISAKMLALIRPGETPSPEFMRLHGLYMAAASIEAIFLLIAAFALPAAMRAPGRGAQSTRPGGFPVTVKS